jgi:ubiquinone/menaquinone biosynthesis C-methylase UbiE
MNTAAKNNSFSDCYLSLRRKEARIMRDEELLLLPETDRDHPYAGEWKKRAWSSRQLKSYLEKKHRPLSILEVGCGNGWLCHRLSYLRESSILGIDINRPELVQARRVFKNRKNLRFLPGTIDDLLPSFRFDVILFAASIQYFPDIEITIRKTLQLLQNDGEIHVLDSHFYNGREVYDAKERSREYFISLNEPGMTEFYFHHSIGALGDFNFRIMYNPGSFFSKMTSHPSPFHWIRIQH